LVGASAPRSGVDVAQEPQAAATFSKVLAHSPHIFLRVDGVMPTTPFLHADGNTLQTGWANSPRVEAEIAAWFDATSFDDELTAMRRLDKTALEEVVTRRSAGICATMLATKPRRRRSDRRNYRRQTKLFHFERLGR